MKTKLFYGIFIVLSMWGLYSCKQAEKPILLLFPIFMLPIFLMGVNVCRL